MFGNICPISFHTSSISCTPLISRLSLKSARESRAALLFRSILTYKSHLISNGELECPLNVLTFQSLRASAGMWLKAGCFFSLIASFRAQTESVSAIVTGKMWLRASPCTKQFISSSGGPEAMIRGGTGRRSGWDTTKKMSFARTRRLPYDDMQARLVHNREHFRQLIQRR